MKNVSKYLLGVAVLLLFGATICRANLISYVTEKANQEHLIAMEEDGTGAVELFVGGRRTPAIEAPTVSPAGLGQTWILFNDHNDLYKIPSEGGEPTLVLCGAGTDWSGTPYDLTVLEGIWSPDGSEILFQLYPWRHVDSTGLALLPAVHTTDGTCTSELVRIYEPPSPWLVWAGPGAWNHDGSRFAFWETNTDTEQGRLVVIERQVSGVWERIDAIELIPGSTDLPDDELWDLSWRPQAESGLLIFRIRDETAFWLASVDLGTREWAYVLDNGSRVKMHGPDSYPRWSSSGDEILYTDPEGDLVRWVYPDGDRQVIGSGIRADWQRNAVVGFCGDGDCAGSETQCNCALDCGAYPSDEAGLCSDLTDNDCDGPIDCEDSDCKWDEACPFCGDFVCNGDETECSCSVDCGTPPSSEAGLCTDGVDNDCDGDFDCDDADCSNDDGCTGGLPGDPCTTGADCISGLCHPRKLTCK